MAIYTIDFTVTKDGVTPHEPQTAGVTGDHCAAVLRFTVPFANYRYRIEIADGGGGYDITDLLDVKDGAVTYAVPSAWTAAGLATLRLVGIETDANGTEIVRFHSAPACVWFDDRENGEALGASLRPAWQETLDSAQFFLQNLSRRVQAGEFKGEKGDKGDTGDVSLVDEIELVMDGGDAGGNIDFEYVEPVDYVVEQGQAGAEDDPIENRWTYRKWASGLVELWSSCNINTAFTTKITDHHYAGASFPQIQYPFHVYGTPYNEGQCIHCQFSLMYSTIGHLGYCLDRYGTNFNRETPKYTPYMPWEDANSHDITARFYVTGRWKE